jgi:DNA-directed RNA polymerase specialized sigma24 family protein
LDHYHWRSGSKAILPKGYEPQDVVQHVIGQAISGQRNWDPEKGELLPWLKDQVKSVVDALAKSAAHRLEIFDRDSGDVDKPASFEAFLEKHVDPIVKLEGLAPEEVVLEEERQKIILAKYAALFYAAEDDPELEEIISAVIDGCRLKPRYLAEHLNVPVSDINNRLKRLRRLAANIKEYYEREETN